MINYLEGTVKHIDEKSVLLLVNGVGFHVQSPQVNQLTVNKTAQLHTYMHWNSDNGPSLFGFTDEITRTLFLLIIDCPKIGPSNGLSILSTITPAQFIEAVTSQNEKILSNVSGVGTKKAEQIITYLKHKVPKLMSKGELTIESNDQITPAWHEVSQAFESLNYSRHEITAALQFLSAKYAGQPATLDQLIRAGLSYLSKAKSL